MKSNNNNYIYLSVYILLWLGPFGIQVTVLSEAPLGAQHCATCPLLLVPKTSWPAMRRRKTPTPTWVLPRPTFE